MLIFSLMFVTYTGAKELSLEEESINADQTKSELPGDEESHGVLVIDQENLDLGSVYLTIKDTYLYFPLGNDDLDLLCYTVKWVKEIWYQDFAEEITSDIVLLSESSDGTELTLYGIASYKGNIFGGRHAVSATYEECGEGFYRLIDYWEPADSDEEKSIKARFPEEDWETALSMNEYDELFLGQTEWQTPECIAVSGNTPEELIKNLYAQMVNNS